MINEILLNQVTRKWVKAYERNPSASLLLKSSGDKGTARKIIEHIHETLVGKSSPLIIIQPDKNSISIDQIRQLQRSMSLVADKTSREITRVAVIYEANLLTTEAQNALLKLIEELPKRSLICLVSDNTNNILETVISRCFLIDILPITRDQAFDYSKANNIVLEESNKAYLLSEGNATLYVQYLKNGYLEAELHINKAKEFIASNHFTRQGIITELYKDKELINRFIYSLELISRTAMRSAKDISSKKKWKSIYTQTIETKKLLSNNVSPKIALLRLSLEI